jgi:Transglutaminase-like superfamily
MFLLACRAFIELLRMDLYLSRNNFSSMYEYVRLTPLSRVSPAPDSIDKICPAVDLAAIWYWKQVPCLQQSAATTCVLRRHGIAAQLVIGAQGMPFRAHAWVEVDGRIVNDKPYTSELYAVVDRC